MKISFCTTCMGRLHQLRKTLPANLADNEDFEPVEFVILDYSSPDGLENWVRRHLSKEIESGRLTYAKLTGRLFFEPAHAKNVAHRVANGDIVCNLDADNFSGHGFAGYLVDLFNAGESIFAKAEGDTAINKGVNGRVAFRKKHFLKLGGYDERFGSRWGYEDRDICYRAIGQGLSAVTIPRDSPYLKCIAHSSEDRLINMMEKEKKGPRAKNKFMSEASVAANEFVANKQTGFGKATLEINFSTHVTL